MYEWENKVLTALEFSSVHSDLAEVFPKALRTEVTDFPRLWVGGGVLMFPVRLLQWGS